MNTGNEFEAEHVVLETKAYEISGSNDDFKTWKMKKYIDERIMEDARKKYNS